MKIDPDEIDKFFKEIEKQIEKEIESYGAYKYSKTSSSTNPYSKFFMEDDNCIYFTIDIGISPFVLKADVENNNTLSIKIDESIEKIRLPTKAEKVENITCVNGILDVRIKKTNEREEEGNE